MAVVLTLRSIAGRALESVCVISPLTAVGVVRSLELRILGCEVLVTKSWLPSPGYKVLATKSWLQSLGLGQRAVFQGMVEAASRLS
jgi:hypothetical protein